MKHPQIRHLLVGAVFVGLLLPAWLAIPSAAADPTAPQTWVPIGGSYETETLEVFGVEVAEQATGETVDIYVVPSSYGDDPADREDNLALAQTRTDQVEAACDTVVDLDQFPGGCVATLLPLLMREDAMNEANSVQFTDPETDGVFILGGDQTLAMRVLSNTPAEENMEIGFSNGVVIGGTSAGNAVQSRSMGAGYPPDGLRWNALERDKSFIYWGDDLASDERGLSFGLQDVILDQHFYQRGRFARTLSWTGQSVARYGLPGKLGVGVDRATGVMIEDGVITRPFGFSSSAIIDHSNVEQPQWVGPNDTLSVQGVLTHLIAPGTGMAYDIDHRSPILDGNHVTVPERFPLPSLKQSGPSALWLGGGQNANVESQPLAEFADAAQTRGSGVTSIVVIAAGYPSADDSETAATEYADALAGLGWSGDVDIIVHGEDHLSLARIARAAGVLFIGGDQALMSDAVEDAKLERALKLAVQMPTPVMTDEAATAVMGEHYVTTPDPGDIDEDAAVAMFRADGSQFGDGLGIVDDVSLEPVFTYHFRWGRLYGSAYNDPDTVVLGVSELTALRLDRDGGTVVGERSVIAADGSDATWMVGSNGTLGAINVWLDVFGPGDNVE
ncbi:MAG: hypothetical protein GEU79_15690 [Acidimicrobiia bacterium]|nr:hypothetical protein [Acidimicrobiia bacterium]